MLHIRKTLSLLLPYFPKRSLTTLSSDQHHRISLLINQKNFSKASSLVKDDKAAQEVLVRELYAAREVSKAIDAIFQFNLDPGSFPEVVWQAKKNCVGYLLNCQPWMKVEENLRGLNDVLGYYAACMLTKGEVDVGLSIIQRYNLLEKGYITNKKALEVLKDYFGKGLDKEFTVIENLLTSNDDYVPTEDLLNEKSVGSYLNLRDFGLDPEKDIVWIGDCQGESFKKAKKDLMEACVVGMDCEYRFVLTSLERNGTSILQLATWKKVYLFDVEKMCDEKEYCEFIREFLESEKVLKVGHSLSGDVCMLRQDSLLTAELKIKNSVDISNIYRKLGSFKNKFSLKFICEDILKKPISKYEQISNWSKRPLRKTQIHYAALDAYIVLEIYKKLKEVPQRQISSIPQGSESTDPTFHGSRRIDILPNLSGIIIESNNAGRIYHFHADNEYKHFYSDPQQVRFLLDNMFSRLARLLRNLGIDAAYLPEKDHATLYRTAMREKRVIITRDRSYFQQIRGIPCMLLHDLVPDSQLRKVMKLFKLEVEEDRLLSRCVKCNHGVLTSLSAEEARVKLQWDNYEDYYNYRKFWECGKCKNIYWEGLAFRRAKVRFKMLALDIIGDGDLKTN